MSRILQFSRTMELGGAEKVVMQLCELMQSNCEKIVVCSCGGSYAKQLESMGISHYTVDDIAEKNPLTMFRIFLKLKRVVKEEKIDIIHTHHRIAAFYARLLTLFHPKIRLLYTAHNVFNDKVLLTRFALRKTGIIAVSNAVKENLCKFYRIPEKTVTVIYNAVNVHAEPISPVPEIERYRSEGYFLVGNVARLSKQKGIPFFLEAIPKILSKNRKVMFYLIGDGEDRSFLEKQIRENHLEDSVIMLGYRSDVINVMKQLDVIVLSSLWEGFPLTPIEAFSVGKTVVATNAGGTPEIVHNRINGLLISPRSASEIADAVLYLINHPEEKRQMEQNAVTYYEDKLSYPAFQSAYLSYYRSVVSGISETSGPLVEQVIK
jgi:glycosyltransferase involved in cell wall biosynthesis